jgi:alkylated DNA repair dioxygenase AlkB
MDTVDYYDLSHLPFSTDLINNNLWETIIAKSDQAIKYVQYFGYKREYDTSEIKKLNDMNNTFALLLKVLLEQFTESTFNQCTLNKYLPGQGMAPFVEKAKKYGSILGIYCFNSNLVINLKPIKQYNKGKAYRILMKPSSLLILNEKRQWSVEIPKVKIDHNGIKRDTAYVYTFRNIV